MTSPFVAEIRIFPFNFAPKGWAFCAGQLLPISQNTALFSLLGTTYGGNGTSTFALPNLQGLAPLQPGQGAGLSLYDLGEQTGSATVTLLNSELPAHSHVLNADTGQATSPSPSGGLYMKGHYDDGSGHAGAVQIYSNQAPDTQLNFAALSGAGSSFPHNNLMPYLTLNFCIAMQGVYPPRS
jgi:microcystin-dependent protein